ncbi:MAG: DNA polymerase IV [Acidobacteria bacterium]|nr:DNA polymerase IV [Acidobacteriota bacterium]
MLTLSSATLPRNPPKKSYTVNTYTMRRILHWDGDGFFASIEQAADKRLRNRPLAIGGAKRGIVLSASLEARRYGIRPGTPMQKARRMCPPLVTIPAHFDLYEQFSDQILMLCEQRTPLIEPAGSGAAWLDLTGTENLSGPALAYAHDLRRTVSDWLRVPLTFALATNKTVARIAARMRKPHAPYEIMAGGEAEFLAPLSLRWLPGITHDHADTLEVAGLKRIGDLARAPLDATEMILGRNALKLQRRAQGIDESPVGKPKQSSEPTWRESIEFPEDVWETSRLIASLRALLEPLMQSVRADQMEVRKLTLGLRYTDREESERSLTLPEPTSVEADFYGHLPALLTQAWQRRVRLRALWLKASRAHAPSPQMSLFEPAPTTVNREKEQRLAAAMDSLKRHFGTQSVRRGLADLKQ